MMGFDLKKKKKVEKYSFNIISAAKTAQVCCLPQFPPCH